MPRSIHRPLLIALFALVLVIAGCSTQSAPPTSPAATATAIPAPTDSATPLPVATPTAIPPTETVPPPATSTSEALSPIATPTNVEVEPTPEPQAADWSAFESITADGFYERGNPNASILILDYSDFL